MKPFRSHYDWLEANLPEFASNLGIDPSRLTGCIVAHGDKCYSYRDGWAKAGIPFEHGVALYFLTYLNPWHSECHETPVGWVAPNLWVKENYSRFVKQLPRQSKATL